MNPRRRSTDQDPKTRWLLVIGWGILCLAMAVLFMSLLGTVQGRD